MMPGSLSNREIVLRAREVLLAEPDLKLALLFGSAATGTMRTDSDVDIACLFDYPLNADQKMRLSLKLERTLHNTVDLVDLYSLSGTILKQILCKSQVLVKKSPADMAQLVRKMIYNQADLMPYVRRTLTERQQRFIHG